MIYKKCIIIIMCLCIINTIAIAQEKQNETSYSSLVEKLKNFDKTVDFKEIRRLYTQTPEYNPYGTDDKKTRDLMNKALDEKKYEEALKYAGEILDKTYVDIDAHLTCKIAYRELKNQKESELHDFIFKGLVKSILASGDGKTKKSPFYVISINEEYVILSVLGLESKTQSVVDDKEHVYDMFTLKGDQKEIYFNIDIITRWLSKHLK
jgi:hypothetical protein